MWAYLVLVTATAAAAGPREPVELAATRVTLSGLYNQKGETYLELAATELRAAGLTVLTSALAAERLEAEQRDRLYGCRDVPEECAVRLGEALGVRGVLQGSIVRPMGETSHQVTLQLRSAVDGRPLATFFEAGVDECCLAEAVLRGARLLVADLGGGVEALAATPAVHSTTTSPLLRKVAWASLAVSGAALAGAGVLLVRRLDLLNDPRGEHPVPGDIRQLHINAEQLRVLGITAAAVGGVALVTWGVCLGLGLRQQPIEPVLSLGPGGFSATLAGRF